MQIAKQIITLARKRSADGAPFPSALQASTGVTQSVDIRVQQFKHELLAEHVDLRQLRRLAFGGIPDKAGLRSVTWKLLLGYLPCDASAWDATLAQKRSEYYAFCEDLVVDPKRANGLMPAPPPDNHQEGPLPKQDITSADHPLSMSSDSKWHIFFKDEEVLEQIERDVMRTHPDMHFFSGDGEDAELHRKEMKRALFMYAKLNPGLKYIQGMNELYAPLYYQFKRDADPQSAAHAEADAFYCFVDLISEFRDHFCEQLDNSQSGIKATIQRLMLLLQQLDAQLWQRLEALQIDPQFYAFRWITLLLTQEFPFPDAVRIWDTLLSDPAGRLDCLLRVCAAMLILQREQLLAADFATGVKLLQRYPATDVCKVLHLAATLSTCTTDILQSNV